MIFILYILLLLQCIQYLDSNILKDLMPKVTDLLKTNVGLATKVATLYFLTHLNEQLKQDLKPYSGELYHKFLFNNLLWRFEEIFSSTKFQNSLYSREIDGCVS